MGLNLRVTGHGNQGGRKYMEDAFVAAYQQSEDQKDLEYAYFGIFDGHGGREAALFAKENLMNNIVSQKSFWSDDDNQVLKAIRYGFLTTHRAMWREVGKWPKTVSGLPSTSGTTSSIAFIRRRKLYIGHVGDSKIVLGIQLPGSTEWTACALTKDHKPESPEEKNRISSVGGLVLKKSGVERVVWNRPRPGHKGPIRRSTPFDQIPFLAVARSLGDLWSFNYLKHEFVVSPDPDVDVFNISPRMHRCIIFASDGLWNMLTTNCAVKIVQEAEEENEKLILEGGKANGVAKQPNNPSTLLVDAALKRWYRLGMRADNTSVVTVMLDLPGPPKSEVLMRQRVMKRLRPRDEQAEEDDESKSINIFEASCSSGSKEKLKINECSKSPAKDRKRSEAANKERRLSSDFDSIPGSLPKPVILSPQPVVKHKIPPTVSPQVAVLSPASRQENQQAIVRKYVSASTTDLADAKTKKKGHDPPEEGEKITVKENENLCDTSSSCMETIKESYTGRSEECSVSQNLLSENGKDKIVSFANSDCFSKSEKMDSSSNGTPNYVNGKKNGRTHLCEVDNFFKLNRTTDCFEAANKAKEIAVTQKNISVPPKLNFRKSTLTRRNTDRHIVKKKARLQQTRFSPCGTNSTQQDFTHNTRAQSGLRKLKV